jgi:hypothetical protein
VGFVDAAAAVRRAAGLALTCTGLEETTEAGNDRALDADVVTIPRPTAAGASIEVDVTDLTSDGGVHSLPRDSDWYSFGITGFPPPTAAVRVSLTLEEPDFGTLVQALYEDTDPSDAISLNVLGVGDVITSALDTSRTHYVSVGAAIPRETNDNCYAGTTLRIELLSAPESDSCEPNESLENPCVVTEEWEASDFLCPEEVRRDVGDPDLLCPDVFEIRATRPMVATPTCRRAALPKRSPCATASSTTARSSASPSSCRWRAACTSPWCPSPTRGARRPSGPTSSSS